MLMDTLPFLEMLSINFSGTFEAFFILSNTISVYIFMLLLASFIKKDLNPNKTVNVNKNNNIDIIRVYIKFNLKVIENLSLILSLFNKVLIILGITIITFFVII